MDRIRSLEYFKGRVQTSVEQFWESNDEEEKLSSYRKDLLTGENRSFILAKESISQQESKNFSLVQSRSSRSNTSEQFWSENEDIFVEFKDIMVRHLPSNLLDPKYSNHNKKEVEKIKERFLASIDWFLGTIPDEEDSQVSFITCLTIHEYSLFIIIFWRSLSKKQYQWLVLIYVKNITKIKH